MLADLLNSISVRTPYLVMNKLVSSKELPTGHGYEKLKANILALKGEERTSAEQDLTSFYEEQILVGEKAVVLLNQTVDGFRESLIEAFRELEIPESTPQKLFPLYLPQADLLSLEDTPYLCSMREDEQYLNVIFSSKRFFTERVEVPLSDIKESEKDDYSGYDEIVAVRRHYQQFFDVVSIPKLEGPIEIRVDAPGLMPKAEINRAVEQIEKELWRLGKNAGLETSTHLEKVNLFPLIDKIYESSTGSICELGFVTDSGGIKTARMRRIADDLRNEAYHKAGSESSEIVPFRIGVRWQRKMADELFSNPELLIPGKFQQLSAPSKEKQYHCAVKRCVSLEDYRFVLDKISQLIN
ncbi:hypothetical protein BKP64_18070 [Marinobacter salinus]|uniref:Uncharacterized protein n=1 Tax=Marinobacter salinus TaxID=1874317 RepID=A0A1D9GQL8_9GAMM|nr:hypothetical protein [Marinobacter salinus]AOY89916.1 hypothetical protein BKP64_18070 [Marinobacter salinus]